MEKIEAQLFMSGDCPSRCSYCYLNKSGLSNKLNNEIREKLKDGSYFDNLEAAVGKKLERLTLIGAEPSINLNLITKKLDLLSKKFPQLEDIRIYSSLAYPDKIINFVNQCGKYNFEVTFRISFGGPKFITDKVDSSGIMSRIPENLTYIVSNLQHTKTNLKLHWNPTIPMSSIREMVEQDSKLDQYITFFEKINKKIKKINKNPKIKLDPNYSPFIARTNQYTKEDGVIFSHFIKKARERNLLNRKNRIITNFLRNSEIVPKDIVCYGGYKSISVGKSIHPCQVSFLFDNDEYLKGFEDEAYKEGLNLVKKNLILDIDKKNQWRFDYLTLAYKNFLKFRIKSIKNIAQEMAQVGQIDKKYTEGQWATLLTSVSVCFVRALINQKTTQLINVAQIKLLGNGALEEMVNMSLNQLNNDE